MCSGFDGKGYTEVALGPLSIALGRRANRLFSARAILAHRKKGGTRPPFSQRLALFRIHHMTATVLLPTLFVVFGAERLFFAVADRLNAVGRDSGRDQCILY
jgi:hypothetical protein